MLAAIVKRLAALRGAVRFRLWVLRTRRALARAGCDLELVAPHGATFSTLPAVEATLQHLGEHATDGRRGKLRIEIGQWVHLGRNTVIEVLPSADNVLRLEDGVRCFGSVRFVLFGGRIRVGPHTRLRDAVMLKSSGDLDCGSHVIVQSFCMFHCHRSLVIEDRASFAERVSVLDSDHLVDGSDEYHQTMPLGVDPVIIGNNTWVGANVVILRGARLGRNALVAAGSVVRAGDYPNGWLVAGAPAEAKKPLPRAAKDGASR
jgi:acetyltransferase-like isoleucine patch superfamily enzyme